MNIDNPQRNAAQNQRGNRSRGRGRGDHSNFGTRGNPSLSNTVLVVESIPIENCTVEQLSSCFGFVVIL